MAREKIKVLIVEDDEALLNLYEKKFTSKGYDVIKAEDGEKGFEAAKNKNPDIILLDIMLPVMNGFEVLKKLEKLGDKMKSPVVILSNYGEAKNITKGLLSGAVEYLIKVEHTPEEVVEVVENILNEKDSLIGKAFKDTAN